jgi:hypothetical protein
MNITQITVSYGETQSLPEYSNVKPNITITAVIEEGEDLSAVEVALWAHAKQQVHEQIDLALEANNIPAKYSTDPRFQVLKTRTSSYYDRGKIELPKLVAIIPNDSKLDDRFVHAGWRDSRKLRYSHAQRLAAETCDEGGYTIVDCADGDLSRLLAMLPEEAKAEKPDTKQDDDLGGPGGVDIYAAAFEEDDDDDDDE